MVRFQVLPQVKLASLPSRFICDRSLALDVDISLRSPGEPPALQDGGASLFDIFGWQLLSSERDRGLGDFGNLGGLDDLSNSGGAGKYSELYGI